MFIIISQCIGGFYFIIFINLRTISINIADTLWCVLYTMRIVEVIGFMFLHMLA